MDINLNEVLEGCQHRVESAADFWNWTRTFQDKWANRPWAFRGQSDSAWPLQSKLYRTTSEKIHAQTDVVDVEAELQRFEELLMCDAYKRGLPFSTGARTSYLHQLALLQHYGAPTRLIDVSFDINIATWFACEANGDADGRLFAFSYATERRTANCLLTEIDVEHMGQDVPSANLASSQPYVQVRGRTLIDHLHCPWKWCRESEPRIEKWKNWSETAYVWRPAHHDRRLLAQNGGFLLGGYPASTSRVSVWDASETKSKSRVIDSSVKTDWSVADPSQWNGRGRTAKFVTLSVVIAKKAKHDILNALDRFHGLSHERIYPDYPGAASHFKSLVELGTPAPEVKATSQKSQRVFRTDAVEVSASTNVLDSDTHAASEPELKEYDSNDFSSEQSHNLPQPMEHEP